MVMNKKEIQKVAIFGAAAGAVTPFLLQYVVMPILNILGGIVPAFSAKLAEPGTISINVRESLTGINTGLGDKVSAWIVDAFGIGVTVPNWAMTIGLSAIGGALLFVLGAYVVNMFGMMKGNAKQKTRNVIFAGSIIAGLILGGLAIPEINLGMFNVLIAMLVNAAILAFVLVEIDDRAGFGLNPFK